MKGLTGWLWLSCQTVTGLKKELWRYHLRASQYIWGYHFRTSQCIWRNRLHTSKGFRNRTFKKCPSAADPRMIWKQANLTWKKKRYEARFGEEWGGTKPCSKGGHDTLWERENRPRTFYRKDTKPYERENWPRTFYGEDRESYERENGSRTFYMEDRKPYEREETPDLLQRGQETQWERKDSRSFTERTVNPMRKQTSDLFKKGHETLSGERKCLNFEQLTLEERERERERERELWKFWTVYPPICICYSQCIKSGNL